MNRPIKFRAWDGERMLRMNQQYGREDQKQICDDSWTRFWEALYRLQEDKTITLMQFTGLTDKNGKEIYEGDILKQPYIWEPNLVVEWQDELGDAGATYGCGWPIADGKYAEIIGNIYENPELLTGKQV